jgi:hypothetical protein
MCYNRIGAWQMSTAAFEGLKARVRWPPGPGELRTFARQARLADLQLKHNVIVVTQLF